MDKYLIIIGGRELTIQATDLNTAVGLAMRQYPGETVTGYQYLGEADPPEAATDAE